MGFSVMLGGAKKLVPAEYWCSYGTGEIWIVIQIPEVYFFPYAKRIYLDCTLHDIVQKIFT